MQETPVGKCRNGGSDNPMKILIWSAAVLLISSQVIAIARVFGYGELATSFVYFWIGIWTEKLMRGYFK